jgi:flagellar motility protein MotE (MotC chaperone)
MSKKFIAFLIIVLGILSFAGGFAGGLWQIGYFNMNEMQAAANVSQPQEWPKIEIKRLQRLALEMDRWGADLKKRAQALDEQESRLNKSTTDLNLEKASLEKLVKKIEDMRKDFDSRLQLIEVSQDSNVIQLAKLYSAMSADSAAKILFTLPDPQAVQVLRKMKEDRSAKILEVWAQKGGDMADKATRITSLLRIATDPTTETP